MLKSLVSTTKFIYFKIINKKLLIIKFFLLYLFIIFMCIAMQSIVDKNFFINEINFLSAPYCDIKGILKSISYVFSYIFSVIFVIFALVQRSTIVYLIFITYIIICFFIDISSQMIVNRSGFTHFQYVLFLNEASNYKNLILFFSDLKKAFLITSIVGTIFLIIRKFINFRISSFYILLFPLFFIPVVVAKTEIHYISYTAYPPFIKTPIIISNYHINKKEQPVRILSKDIMPVKKQTENIILIIDESISGNFLSINGYNRSTTPHLEKLVYNGKITNFGVVNSIANCSATSQLFLRIGMNQYTEGADNDFINTRITLPTIYQYAKRAGYKTWLIDAQADQGSMTNYITYNDFLYIDEYYTNNSRIEDFKRDFAALAELKKIMVNDNNKNKFIVFVKDGAHWPYLWRYPKDLTMFNPVQNNEYEPRTRENKTKVINTYLNLIKYTVDDFFKIYVEKINLKNSITFYTSDHGQAFMEDGAKDDLTHCSTYYDPPSSQAAVPLLVVEQSEHKKYVPKDHRVYSQHQIFPSILMEMGYPDDVISRYGNTLLSGYPENTERWFYWSLEGNRSLYKHSTNHHHEKKAPEELKKP